MNGREMLRQLEVRVGQIEEQAKNTSIALTQAQSDLEDATAKIAQLEKTSTTAVLAK